MEPSMNLPPTIATLPDTSIAVGDTLWTRVEATDPDGDEISYQLTVFLTLEELRDGYRAQAGMNGAKEEFWFVPKRSDRPQRRFKITATDTSGGRDSTTFTVEVP